MRNRALLICLYSLIMGAFGSFLRWLQHLNAFEADTGLLVSGSSTTTLVVVFMALYLCGLLCWALWLKKRLPADVTPSLQKNGGLVAAGGYVIAFIMLVGAVMLLMNAEEMKFSVLMRVLAMFAVLAAASLPFITQNGRFDGMMQLSGICSMVPVAFSCFWLIVSYKMNAADPVVWDYAIEVITVACLMLTFYFVAGFFVGRGKPIRTIFFCNLSAFLVPVTLADKRDVSLEVIFAASGLFLLLISFVLLLRLTDKKNPQ